jgi:hypothetical protein
MVGLGEVHIWMVDLIPGLDIPAFLMLVCVIRMSSQGVTCTE